ncbi:MAG: four helix bundle protein [Prolixibacteraceae bacterium]|nr:four helix bundle protein [Prolixibacteraceae bacterium]
MHNYLELKFWKKSRELVKQVYLITDSFPKNQQFCLSNQMQRAVISIPSNIAEGAGRNSSKEFVRFLDIANGSAFELETQLFLSYDFGYVTSEIINSLISDLKEIQKMIYKFRLNLEKKDLDS